MKLPNYRHANNVKYLVEGIPLRRWCNNNGYPYSAAVQMLKRGVSVEDMIKRLKSNYEICSDSKLSYKTFIAKYGLEYATASRDRRLEIRSIVESFCESRYKLYDATSEVFELIVTGKYNGMNLDSIQHEIWLPVPEDIRYQVSSMGNFRHILKDGSYRVIRPYVVGRKNKEGIISRYYMEVKIGSRVRVAARVVAEVHLPKPSRKHSIVHLIDSLDFQNIAITNLKWVTPWMHGHLTGHSVKTSIPVNLLDDLGNIEETFPSVREAAKELGISYTTVLEICKGRTKKPLYNLQYGDVHENYIPTWGYGGGKRRIEVQS